MQKKNKNWKRLLGGILCFAMVFSLGLEWNGLTALAASETESVAPMATIAVSTWADLRSEIKAASGSVDITLGDNITWEAEDQYIVLTEGKTVTLHLDGHNITGRQDTTGASTYEYALFEVDQNAELTIDGNGTLTSNKAGYGIVYVKGGTFNMAGGTITGNNFGAGVVLYGGNFHMLGNAEITNNISPSQSGNGGGGVEVTDGSFTMSGGSVHDNTAEKTGGGVWLYGDCSFTMTGGDIYNNTAYDGGGVFFYGTGTNSFTMNGGKIYGNTVKYTSSNSNGRGGGVYIEGNSSNTTFDMSDGEIYGNHADGSGGGVCVYNKAVFNLSGGTIHNNEVTNNTIGNGSGGGVSIDGNTGSNSILMTGGTISENTAHSNGGGLFIASRASMCMLRDGEITGNHLVNEIQNGGGVYVGGSNLTLSGNIRITGNTGKTNAANNLHLSFGSGRTVFLDQALGADAKVGVHWSYGSRYFAEAVNGHVITDEDASKFSADQSGFVVEFGYNGDGLQENKLILHNHMYDGTYTIDGNKITKKCAQTEPFCKLHSIGVSATVTAEDAVYTGKPYTGAEVTQDDGFTETVKLGYSQLENDGTYTSLSGAPTSPGSYRAKISTYTTGSKYAYDSFVIKKQTITITPATPQDATYDGRSKTGYTGSATFEPAWTGSPDVTYYLADGNTKTTTENSGATGEGLAPKFAGDYKITFSIPTWDKNNTGSATISFTIKPKDITVGITPNGGVFKGEITPAKAVLNNVAAVDESKVPVTLTYAGTANDGTTIYNGTEVPSKAGTYTLTASISNKNYKLTGTNSTEFVVEKAEAGLSVSAVADKTFGEEDFNLISTMDSNGALSYTSSNEEVLKVDADGKVHIVGAGEADVTVSADAAPNYKAGSQTISIKVKKKAGKLTVTNTTYNVIYGDEPFSIGTINSEGESDIAYKSNDEKVVTVDKDGKVTIVGAGKTSVTLAMTESANYNKVETSVEVNVAPKAITVTADNKTKIYGDKDETLTWTSKDLVGSDTLTDITATREVGEDVNAYAIALSQKTGANSNYVISFNTGTYTIEQKDITGATVTLGAALMANGKAQSQEVESVIVKNSEGKDLAVTYDVTDNSGTDAGSYTMTITGNKNYKGTVTKTFVITPSTESEVEENEDGDAVIGSGTIGFTVETDGKAPVSELKTDKAAMLQTLIAQKDLTSDELAMVADGATIDVILKVTDASETITTDSKKQMEAVTSGYNMGQYIDISLFKQVIHSDGEKEKMEPLTTTGDKIQISVQVPSNLISTNSSITRTYYIVRNHNGKAEFLPTTYDAGKKALSFETDKFSDYAIVYKDKSPEVKTNELSLLLAKGKYVKNMIKLTWLKENKATGYEVYWSYCNGKQNYKKLATTKKLSYTAKKLKKNKEYKYFVKSYRMVNGKKTYISKSPVIHVAMKNSNLANVKSISVKSSKVILRVNKTSKIKASYKKLESRKRLLLHTAKYRYYTTNKSVATVSSKGKITAKKKGTCNIYVIANNGVYKKVKVSVK